MSAWEVVQTYKFEKPKVSNLVWIPNSFCKMSTSSDFQFFQNTIFFGLSSSFVTKLIFFVHWAFVAKKGRREVKQMKKSEEFEQLGFEKREKLREIQDLIEHLRGWVIIIILWNRISFK